MHGSRIPDIISQGVDELLAALGAICITYEGISATEKLGHGGSISNDWNIREDCVSGNSFILPRDVEDRISSFEMLLEIVLGCSSRAIPGGDLEGVLNGSDGCPIKVEFQSLSVYL